jgi:hypothetical protein
MSRDTHAEGWENKTIRQKKVLKIVADIVTYDDKIKPRMGK